MAEYAILSLGSHLVLHNHAIEVNIMTFKHYSLHYDYLPHYLVANRAFIHFPLNMGSHMVSRFISKHINININIITES